LRDEADLIAEARQANQDGGVNGADVVSGAGGHRSVGGIAKHDGVNLVWIVIVAGGEMCMSGVTQGIEDQGERTDGGNGSEQDGSGAEWLAASDIEAGSGECGAVGGQGPLHEWVILGLSRGEPGWRRFGGVGHTDSVDAPPKGGVNR
jgi:hypothetical protein